METNTMLVQSSRPVRTRLELPLGLLRLLTLQSHKSHMSTSLHGVMLLALGTRLGPYRLLTWVLTAYAIEHF